MEITVYEDILDKENNSIYIDKYISFFMDKLQDKMVLEDGSTILENELASKTFLNNQLDNWNKSDDFKKWLADDTLDKIHKEIKGKGMHLCPLNFFTLCQYILNLIKSQYFVLLKPTIADTIAELKDVKSITFENGDNTKITTNNTNAIKCIIDSLKADSCTSYEAFKIVSIDKMTNKVLLQASFAYNVSLFLKCYFADYPRRSNCCMVSSTEQKLILYMLYFFGLSPVQLTDSRYRQLIGYYQKHRSRVTISKLQNVGIVPIELVKYKQWKDGIDLDKISPMEVGETVNFNVNGTLTDLS